MRAIGSEGVLPGEPSVFNDEWLPIVIGDGMLVMDTSQSVVAPVYAVDFPDLGADVSPTPDLPSLGALIQTWTLALKERAIWYDHDEQLFNIDMGRLDALGIFTTFALERKSRSASAARTGAHPRYGFAVAIR